MNEEENENEKEEELGEHKNPSPHFLIFLKRGLKFHDFFGGLGK